MTNAKLATEIAEEFKNSSLWTCHIIPLLSLSHWTHLRYDNADDPVTSRAERWKVSRAFEALTATRSLSISGVRHLWVGLLVYPLGVDAAISSSRPFHLANQGFCWKTGPQVSLRACNKSRTEGRTAERSCEKALTGLRRKQRQTPAQCPEVVEDPLQTKAER